MKLNMEMWSIYLSLYFCIYCLIIAFHHTVFISLSLGQKYKKKPFDLLTFLPLFQRYVWCSCSMCEPERACDARLCVYFCFFIWLSAKITQESKFLCCCWVFFSSLINKRNLKYRLPLPMLTQCMCLCARVCVSLNHN